MIGAAIWKIITPEDIADDFHSDFEFLEDNSNSDGIISFDNKL